MKHYTVPLFSHHFYQLLGETIFWYYLFLRILGKKILKPQYTPYEHLGWVLWLNKHSLKKIT